ncbi:hypothetical protein C8R43DRAFT_904509 [Mycena crocata]|nr:hypothetical protein C8R43DRAFT_904509 [Mycena crocata]
MEPGLAFAQGWLVHSLMTMVGSGILLLDTIWDSYQSIAARVVGERSTAIPSTPQPQAMLRFLRSSLKAISSGRSGSDTLDAIQKTAEKALVAELKRDDQMDHKMPFREYGPSYKSVCRDDGPFSPNWIRTRAGFFSALLFRGVTFHTSFVRNHTLFEDLDAWETAIDGLPRGNYVTSCTYGGFPNARRAKDAKLTARAYWEMSGVAQNLAWLTRMTPPTFTAFYDFILEFPQIGSLSAQLLTADYALHGVVKMPTLREQAILVHSIDKGAVSGLQALGYLPAEGPFAQNKVVEAFEALYNYLDAELLQTEKDMMRFSPILLEHALCKIGRVAYLVAVKPLFPELREKRKKERSGKKKKKAVMDDFGDESG